MGRDAALFDCCPSSRFASLLKDKRRRSLTSSLRLSRPSLQVIASDSIWDTRVQDFEAFVSNSGYDATGGMLSIAKDGNGETTAPRGKRPDSRKDRHTPSCGSKLERCSSFSLLAEFGRNAPQPAYRLA